MNEHQTGQEPPDLSEYSAVPDDAHEWFLSDHPWAVAERRRRRTAHFETEQRTAAEVRAWTDKIDNLEPGTTSGDFEAAVRRLADSMRPMADQSQLRAQVDAAEPDEIAVLEARRLFEIRRRNSGDFDYEYPAHLIGAAAAAYPPPASGFRSDDTEAPRTARNNHNGSKGTDD